MIVPYLLQVFRPFISLNYTGVNNSKIWHRFSKVLCFQYAARIGNLKQTRGSAMVLCPRKMWLNSVHSTPRITE